MTLDPAYLEYAARGRGMDHGLYRYSSLFDRPPVDWPEGKTVAIACVVSLEWFPMVPEDKPFRAPGHMQTAYPDYRHYTAREYGTRVGFYRLLDAFDKAGVRASIATNGAIAERYPRIIEDIVAAGHEIVAHSTDMNGTIATGLPEEDEKALIARSLASLESASGTRPKGWLSIARSQSWNTPRLLAEAGLAYMCDWPNDELPYRMETGAGSIVNLPLNHELSDRQILNVQQQSADSYVEQIKDAYRWLAGEAQHHGGRMLPLHLTPYIVALPYRIAAFESLLAWLADQDGSWFATCGDVVDQWSAQNP
ncbi:polysaccharide deacetylase family protein [Altererythrobacter marinus]|uniref:Chitooligosaccharide deacetylase n=1 Tax=Pelagerythrobacter marinus TaxID=538382 RepID=A0ABW9UX99_9SPHN|nr:polysaccharide deacetylase family protein [Pelagerythrobacter marinus]MXO69459.1 polysaccharide deacetylase family protein [Pelagerythrobacter marinus]